MHRARLLAAIGALLCVTPAHADWHSPNQIFHGTAHTLEQGEWMIGVFTPVAYGINDQLTIVVHPVLWVLLTPNAAVRWRVLDTEKVDLSLHTEGTRTFLPSSTGAFSDPRPLGHVNAGLVASFALGTRVHLTLSAAYQRDFAPAENELVFAGGITWLITPAHVLTLQGGAGYAIGAKDVSQPSAMLLYMRAWDNFHLGIGLAYGTFPIALVAAPPLVIPVWPVVDVWWRF